MSSFELIVHLNGLQHLLIIATRETLAEIQQRIESMCKVDLRNREYVLEIYDTKLDDYIVLTDRYLVELHKSLSAATTTTTQRLKARLEPLHRKEDSPTAFIGYSNYVIVWLDEHIGRPQQYLSLKRVFNSMVDANGASRLANDEWYDFENLIQLEREPVHTTIHFFDKSDDCITFVRKNAASTAIFLVISSQLARIIVPLIVDQVRAIYVLSTYIETDLEWALNYVEHIQLFDFDTDLVVRLTRDIADYCVEQGKKRMKDNDPEKAFEYFSDARKLFLRANVYDGQHFDRRLNNTYHLLQRLTLNSTKSSQCEEA